MNIIDNESKRIQKLVMSIDPKLAKTNPALMEKKINSGTATILKELGAIK